VKDGRPIKDSSDPTKFSNHWYRLKDHSYLPKTYLDAPPDVPVCGSGGTSAESD
jgi:hypothetical protein